MTKFGNHTKEECIQHFTNKNDYNQYLMDIFTPIMVLMFQTDEKCLVEVAKRGTEWWLKWEGRRLNFHHNL